jgi:hypothetical protein
MLCGKHGFSFLAKFLVKRVCRISCKARMKRKCATNGWFDQCGAMLFGLRRLDAALQRGGLTPLQRFAGTDCFLFTKSRAQLKSGVKPPQSK